MALPASDTFTGSNGTALATYSASWTIVAGNFQIQSNSAGSNGATSGTECAAAWTADAFNDDHYAEGTCAQVSSAGAAGVAVRVQETDNCYGFYSDNGASQLFRLVSNVWTQFGSSGSAWAASDVVRLTIEGTTLTPLLNGSTSGAPSAVTTSHIGSGGSAGISGWGNTPTGCRVDNFSADDVGGGGGGGATNPGWAGAGWW